MQNLEVAGQKLLLELLFSILLPTDEWSKYTNHKSKTALIGEIQRIRKWEIEKSIL